MIDITNELNVLKIKDEYEIKELSARLESTGFAVFETELNEEKFVNLASHFGEIFYHKDGNSDGITKITNEGTDKDPNEPGLSAFSTAEQTLHTDRSGEKDYPNLNMLYCVDSSSVGGEAWIADGKFVYEHLYENYPQTLKLLCSYGSTIFGGSSEYLAGSIFSINEEGHIILRYRDDELGYYPYYLFPHIQILKSIFEKFKITLKLNKNQGYIIKNDRMLHGRNSFRGTRTMWRVLLNTKSSSDITSGFITTSKLREV